MHVREAKRLFKGATLPWLCDNMANDLKKALGGLNNPEFVFDPDGKIVRLRDWSSPTALRADLENLVGPIDKPTLIEDLNIKAWSPRRDGGRGVVPRIDVPERMRPVRTTPTEKGENPYYAKLRAEADDGLLKTGNGKLYFSVRMDPLYHMHWNNLADPIEFEIIGSEGVNISPSSGKGPKVEVDADSEPREFLLDVKDGNATNPLELTLRYFACHDEEGWCKPVTQSYTIHLERDRDAGVVSNREWSVNRGRGGPPRRGGPPGDGPPEGFTPERLFRFDRNDDGKVSKEELPEFLRERVLPRLDANKDGVIDKQEAGAASSSAD